jgi:hypothetical protein
VSHTAGGDIARVSLADSMIFAQTHKRRYLGLGMRYHGESIGFHGNLGQRVAINRVKYGYRYGGL